MRSVTLTQVRCPVSDHRLFDAWWVAQKLIIRVRCTCGRIVQVDEACKAVIVGDRETVRPS